MSIGTEDGAPWDERAALEELDRLKRGIEEWRQRRKEVQAEFDRFVRGFRTMPPERETLDPAAVNSAVRKTDLALGETLAAGKSVTPPSAPLTSLAIPPVTVEGPAISPSDPEPSTTPPHSPIVATAVNDGAPSREQRTRRTQVIAVTGGLAAVIAAGALLMRTSGGKPDGSSGASKQSTAGRAIQVPRPAVPSEPTPVPDAPRSEITALRRVWVRVIVDGTREVEREMQAGERIPLRAGRTTVIRAGNAGAVRVTINGEDRGTLGPEGEVVTRTLQTPTLNR